MNIFDRLKRYSTQTRTSYGFNPKPYVAEKTTTMPSLNLDVVEEYELIVTLGVRYRARPYGEELRAAEKNARRRLAHALYDAPLMALDELRAAIHAGDPALALKLCDQVEDAMIYGRDS